VSLLLGKRPGAPRPKPAELNLPVRTGQIV
jgi:hypothetical protein